jgi:hypothetical protein
LMHFTAENKDYRKQTMDRARGEKVKAQAAAKAKQKAAAARTEAKLNADRSGWSAGWRIRGSIGRASVYRVLWRLEVFDIVPLRNNPPRSSSLSSMPSFHRANFSRRRTNQTSGSDFWVARRRFSVGISCLPQFRAIVAIRTRLPISRQSMSCHPVAATIARCYCDLRGAIHAEV